MKKEEPFYCVCPDCGYEFKLLTKYVIDAYIVCPICDELLHLDAKKINFYTKEN